MMKPAFLPYQPDTEFFTGELCYITELSNSAADEAMSVALARVAPGVTTRWHSLRETAERYLILSGQGVAEIGDQAPRTVGPQDVILIPAGCRQRIRNTGSDDLVFYAICTPRFLAENYQDLENPVSD
ncbi:cupin domain-containing protein [Undibacterium luofuense]|uniref:Cupin domain-containing protein n=1 Tax=Undibacterium luofuense TaxID=2828733 RepID=A0A941DMW9_9BURK|nr:cupin domain-containing protein [Undibacterium luofuense]MBR7783823.1 cupin domain-containing protein [Undibacterium luofuense]